MVDIKVYCSWKSEYQSHASRVVNLTDEVLDTTKIKDHIPILRLQGFLTGFTIEKLYEYTKKETEQPDFGILGCDQLIAVSEFIRIKELNVNQLDLLSWNGQKTVSYLVVFPNKVWNNHHRAYYYPSFRFSISLNENVAGPVSENSLPVEGIPEQGLRIFDKIVKLNTTEEFVISDEDKCLFYNVRFHLINEPLLGYKFKICISDRKFGEAYVVLVRTDISLFDVYRLASRFIKMCRSIENLEWEGISLNEEFFEQLKSIANVVAIERPWTISTQLNNESMVDILKDTDGLFEKFYITEIYFKKEILSHQALAIYLGKTFKFDYTLIVKSDGSGGYSNPLTDDLLMIFSGKGKDLPSSFTLKIYTSMFTAEGIKSFMEALGAHGGYTSVRYHLGKLHESNKGSVEEMITEIEADETDLWKVKKEEKNEICSVTIEWTMSYLLGSFIPNPVSADIVSFLTDEEICQFNMISPRAHAIVNTFKLMKNDFQSISFDSVRGAMQITIIKKSREGYSFRTLHAESKKEIKHMGTILLSKSRVHKEISFSLLKVDKDVIEMFLKASAEKIYFFSTKMKVSSELFLEFLNKHPRVVFLEDVEISNQLLNHESFLLLKNINVFRSWKNASQNFESRIINVTNATLEEIMIKGKSEKPKILSKLNLRGFLTGFTVDGIKSYTLECSSDIDFGILGCDQIGEVVNLIKSDDVEILAFKLHGWNVQKTLLCKVSYTESRQTYVDPISPSLKFAVSLNETIAGPVSDDSLPVQNVPAEGLQLFDKFVKILNDTEDLDVDEIEKLDMDSIEVLLHIHPNHGNKLEICLSDEKFGQASVELVRTDIAHTDVYRLVAKFMKMCRSVIVLNWDKMSMIDGFYEKLTAAGLHIKNEWTKETESNIESILDVQRSTGFMIDDFYFTERYFHEERLSNKMLATFLGMTFQLHRMDLLEIDDYFEYSSPLTNNFLLKLSEREENLSNSFSLKIYKTIFTAEGIKSFMEALGTHTGYPIYHLGIIDESNKAAVEEMVVQLEADDSWKVEKVEKENICSVTIEKAKVDDSYGYKISKTVFTVSFDIDINQH